MSLDGLYFNKKTLGIKLKISISKMTQQVMASKRLYQLPSFQQKMSVKMKSMMSLSPDKFNFLLRKLTKIEGMLIFFAETVLDERKVDH